MITFEGKGVCRRIRRIAAVLVVQSALSLLMPDSQVWAQKCGAYWVRVSATDKFGEPPRRARVVVTPELKLRWRSAEFITDAGRPGFFQLTLSEHDLITGEYELRVEAPGFKAYRQKIRFEHCWTQHIKAELEKDRRRPPRRRRRPIR